MLYISCTLERMFFRMLFTSRLSPGIKYLHKSFMKLDLCAAELHRVVHPNKKEAVFVRSDPYSLKVVLSA